MVVSYKHILNQWFSPFSSLISKMSMVTPAISCLTTSNLPWFMGLTFQFLCNIVLYSIRLYFHHQSYPQRGGGGGVGVFWLWLYFLFLELSLQFSNSILCTYDLGSSSFIVISFCLFIQKCFAIPFTSEPGFARILHHDPSILGSPTCHGSWFHWVRQGCGPCDQFG